MASNRVWVSRANHSTLLKQVFLSVEAVNSFKVQKECLRAARALNAEIGYAVQVSEANYAELVQRLYCKVGDARPDLESNKQELDEFRVDIDELNIEVQLLPNVPEQVAKLFTRKYG